MGTLYTFSLYKNNNKMCIRDSTGGVVGSAAGTVQSCFNTGDVTGIYSLGGIAGGCASSKTKITDCYNWGNVESLTPASTFSDTATKGVGGVVGDPCSASNSESILTNCYNAGTIVNKSTIADIVLGGVIGSSSGNNYSGTTTNIITAKNCYYLSADGLNGDGANAGASGITAKTDVYKRQVLQYRFFTVLLAPSSVPANALSAVVPPIGVHAR